MSGSHQSLPMQIRFSEIHTDTLPPIPAPAVVTSDFVEPPISVPNFRDINSACPKFIKPGCIFRSASPANASPVDVQYLMGTLGLRSILDLRSPSEAADDIGEKILLEHFKPPRSVSIFSQISSSLRRHHSISSTTLHSTSSTLELGLVNRSASVSTTDKPALRKHEKPLVQRVAPQHSDSVVTTLARKCSIDVDSIQAQQSSINPNPYIPPEGWASFRGEAHSESSFQEFFGESESDEVEPEMVVEAVDNTKTAKVNTLFRVAFCSRFTMAKVLFKKISTLSKFRVIGNGASGNTKESKSIMLQEFNKLGLLGLNKIIFRITSLKTVCELVNS